MVLRGNLDSNGPDTSIFLCSRTRGWPEFLFLPEKEPEGHWTDSKKACLFRLMRLGLV